MHIVAYQNNNKTYCCFVFAAADNTAPEAARMLLQSHVALTPNATVLLRNYLARENAARAFLQNHLALRNVTCTPIHNHLLFKNGAVALLRSLWVFEETV